MMVDGTTFSLKLTKNATIRRVPCTIYELENKVYKPDDRIVIKCEVSWKVLLLNQVGLNIYIYIYIYIFRNNL